ncbi:MAG: UDP-glucose/GDP-mannose dehydrogenase family protein, partial [Chloroflexota bacterium]|nr:UDP-glucose/GDP-mannose dehydrogenase family protein [Chloroflexota bacterium]
MELTIFGTGYVGLVTAACFADVGNDVLGVDIDEAKIELLERGGVPIYEPGLGEMLAQNRRAGRLAFTTDANRGVGHGEIIFIAVGTPTLPDGGADLRAVNAVAATIGEMMDGDKIVVTKSTVPVGTAHQVREIIRERLEARGMSYDFDVVSNPEFLKEGAAIEDFMKPDRIVIGSSNPASIDRMSALYAPFNRNRSRLMVMDTRSAELTKYAANAMLATKISFMNELANIAERVGADIEAVRLGIGSDPRIGYEFIYPGVGYGGSCFPKDVRALEHSAAQVGYTAELLRSVEAVNDRQKQRLLGMVTDHFGQDLRNRTFAVWGLAFKPKTDDIREAPSLALIDGLWAAGASVRAFDPEAMDEAHELWGKRANLQLCETKEQALDGADALILVTEWRPFRSPDFAALKVSLKQPVVFDGRNVYDPERMAREGFTYYGIG